MSCLYGNKKKVKAFVYDSKKEESTVPIINMPKRSISSNSAQDVTTSNKKSKGNGVDYNVDEDVEIMSDPVNYEQQIKARLDEISANYEINHPVKGPPAPVGNPASSVSAGRVNAVVGKKNTEKAPVKSKRPVTVQNTEIIDLDCDNETSAYVAPKIASASERMAKQVESGSDSSSFELIEKILNPSAKPASSSSSGAAGVGMARTYSSQPQIILKTRLNGKDSRKWKMGINETLGKVPYSHFVLYLLFSLSSTYCMLLLCPFLPHSTLSLSCELS